MLDFNFRGAKEFVSNPQNIYDGLILGLNYMPTKPVAVATAAMVSGVALYLMQPETLLNQMSVIAISSGIGVGATVTAQHVAGKLLNERSKEIFSKVQENLNKPEIQEQLRQFEESLAKSLEELYADPTLLKGIGLEKQTNS